LEGRLRRLESRLTDSSTFVPHTRAWLVYWLEELGKLMSSDGYRMPGPTPLEAIRAAMQLRDDLADGKEDARYWERVQRLKSGVSFSEIVESIGTVIACQT
jgi:hypothetical protein